MSPVYYKSKPGLNHLFDEHSAEGISILTDKPSKMMSTTIKLLFGLLVAGLLWSFFGRADVIVIAAGKVIPESREHPIYTPTKGELVDIYFSAGMPVSRGDILARINSPSAIQFAGQAIQAELMFSDNQKAYELFPAKKKAMEKQLNALKSDIEVNKRRYAHLVSESIAKLSEEQTLKLKKARAKLKKATKELDHAKRVMDKHERLFKSPGGGGVSLQKVDEKKKEYQGMILDVELAEVELGEFEIALGTQYDKKKEEIEKKAQQIMAMESKYESQLLSIAKEEKQVEVEYRTAQAKVRTSSRISYDDFDEDNFLRIRAPIDGIVTKTVYQNVGVKVDKDPIAMIAPLNTRKILEIAIDERDRAFLKVGMPIKIKVNAFAYQRYGFLKGKLEYIAPVTNIDRQSKKSAYKARVGLEEDYFTVNKTQIPLQYGMEAKAEIIVRKRRLIDLALDPFRNVVG